MDAGSHRLSGYPGGAQYYDYLGEPYIAYFREPFVYGAESRGFGVYTEDTVTVGDRLTLNLGLRFDQNNAVSPDLPRFDNYGEDTGARVSGLENLYTWNVVSPRLGFNLKLTDDGRTLLHGNWGRYHEGVFLAEAAALHPGITPIGMAFYDPAAGDYSDFTIVLDPTAQLGIDPRTKSPYTDQLSVGIERQVGAEVAVSGTFVHKDGRDFIGWVDTAGIYEPGEFTLNNGESVPVFSLVSPEEDRRFLLTNRDELFLRYNGLLLTFEKRWSDRWQALVSYSVSEAYGLQASSHAAPGSGQVSSTFGSNIFGRDPNHYTNATGPLNNDRTHMFRVQGAVEVPGIEVLIGANFQHLTGQPWAAHANVRLPQGVLPVFTELKGTRRLSSQTLLDLRISKIFRFGTDGRIELLADILNVLNDTAEMAIVTSNLFSPNFDQPTRFVDPLRAMLGVKLGF